MDDTFHINRYDSKCAPSKSQELELLKRLNAGAERRRRSDGAKDDRSTIEEGSKKKRKSLDDSSGGHQSFDRDASPLDDLHESFNGALNATTNDEPKKTTKKKKKKKQVKFDGVVETSNILSDDGVEELSASRDGTIENDSNRRGKLKRVDSESPRKKKKPKARVENESAPKVSEIGGFTILGRVEEETLNKVKRVLPAWLTTPTVISTNLCQGKRDILEFPMIHELLVNNLKENNMTHFFPVQTVVIPWILQNDSSFGRAHDICVSAPTGSGKTLAYALPIVQHLRKRVVTAVRALVVVPVKDLALQVYQVFNMCCKKTGVKVGLLDGEKKFADEQALLVRSGVDGHQVVVDIVVATPGRLVDHIVKTQGFCLKQLKYLVLDEADRLMEEIKQDWLQILEQRLDSYCNDAKAPPLPGVATARNGTITCAITPFNINRWSVKPQKLLFSATLSQNPEKLQQLNLFQPKLFTSIVREDESQSVDIQRHFIGKYTTPAELDEYYIKCERELKPLMLYYLLEHCNYRRVLCFANSIETTKRLAMLMRKMTSLSIRHITSNLPINARTRFLDDFKNDKIDVIISTDMYGRGMDIDDVRFVVSYDIPTNMKRYIHRIGRTARAGKKGTAVALLLKHEVAHFQSFVTSSRKERVNELKIDADALNSYRDHYETTLTSMKTNSSEKQ